MDSICVLSGLETNCDNAEYARLCEGIVEYHVHKIKAIAEMALKTTYRQRHLVEMDDDEFLRIMETWNLGHLLSSEPVPDDKSVSGSHISEAENQTG